MSRRAISIFVCGAIAVVAVRRLTPDNALASASDSRLIVSGAAPTEVTAATAGSRTDIASLGGRDLEVPRSKSAPEARGAHANKADQPDRRSHEVLRHATRTTRRSEASIQIATGEPGQNAGETPVTPRSRIALARDAKLRGDTEAARGLLLEAWEDAATRAEAAEALWALHRAPGFSLRPDREQLARTMALLGEGFRRHETPGFVVVSDASDRWTQERAKLLERARSNFFRVAKRMGLAFHPHRHKLLCVLFDDQEAYRRFARDHDGVAADWVAGYYASGANRIVSYNDARSADVTQARAQIEAALAKVAKLRADAHDAERRGDAALAGRMRAAAEGAERQVRLASARLESGATESASAKVVHEAIHLLAYNTGVQRAGRDYPFWLTEGLATSFEFDGSAGAFGPDRSRGLASRRQAMKELAASGQLAPIEVLLLARPTMEWDATQAEAMYAQSHALFRVLFNRDPRAMGRYVEAIGDRGPGRMSAEEQLSLFTTVLCEPGAIDLASER